MTLLALILSGCQSGGTGDTSMTGDTSVTDEASVTEKPDGTDEASVTEKPDGTDEASNTDKTDGTDEASVTDKTDGSGVTYEPKHASGTSGKRKIIIDTDTAADDAAAIIFAAENPDIELLGVTVLVGNVDIEQGTKNALMSLQKAGADVPVYLGMEVNSDGLNQEAVSVYGEDGMGDAGLIHPEGVAEGKNAIDFILEMADKYPNELEIVESVPQPISQMLSSVIPKP